MRDQKFIFDNANLFKNIIIVYGKCLQIKSIYHTGLAQGISQLCTCHGYQSLKGIKSKWNGILLHYFAANLISIAKLSVLQSLELALSIYNSYYCKIINFSFDLNFYLNVF